MTPIPPTAPSAEDVAGLVARLRNRALAVRSIGKPSGVKRYDADLDGQTADFIASQSSRLTELEAENARLTRDLKKSVDLYVEAELALSTSHAENARLRAQVAGAREALQPFADVAESYDPDEGDGASVAWAHDFTLASIRRAREVRRTLTPAQETSYD